MSKRWIEAFRVGGKASRGITPEHLAEVVADDFEANPRALCFGHPKSDDPAAGQITGAKVEGNSLMVEVANLTEKAINGIKSGEWLNRSAAFFDPHHEANPRPGKWSLRHVGLLGAAAPGIPGMGSLQKALAFNAEDELITEGDPAAAVIFAGAPTDVEIIFESKEKTMDPNDQTKTDAALKLREDAFAARVRNQFEASNKAAINALVRDGKILPAEADGLVNSFNALDPEGEELTFGAGDKATKDTAVSHILSFMASALGKRVDVSGEVKAPAGEFAAKETKTSDDPQADARSITAAAKALQAKDPSLTFEAAVETVSAAG